MRPQRGHLQRRFQPVVELTAFSFGRTAGAVFTCEEMLHPQLPGFLPLGGRREILQKRRHQRCSHPGARNSADHHGAQHHPLPQLNRLPNSHVPRRLCRSRLDRDFACAAGGSGKGAGLEEAYRPKPFVEPGGGFVGRGHSRKKKLRDRSQEKRRDPGRDRGAQRLDRRGVSHSFTRTSFRIQSFNISFS